MTRRLASTRRLILLGLAALGALAVATIPRSNSPGEAGDAAGSEGGPGEDHRAEWRCRVPQARDRDQDTHTHATILDDIKENAKAPSAIEQIGEAMGLIPATDLAEKIDEMLADPQILRAIENADSVEVVRKGHEGPQGDGGGQEGRRGPRKR